MGKKKCGVSGDAGGNTKISRVNQCKRWCFTYNNYTDADYENLKNFFNKKGIRWLIGKEVGDSGTPHLQGYIECPYRCRWSEFNLPPQIHWEKCIGNREKNLDYCTKDGNYENHPFFAPIKIITTLYEWQKNIEALLLTEPNGRTIHWISNASGNIGKSAFCKYMVVKHRALCIQGGKLSDIINIIFNADMLATRMILIDIPRCNKNYVSYAAIECILNGMITNTKFETGVKIFNPPHVICFSNFDPDIEELSSDRWNIIKL